MVQQLFRQQREFLAVFQQPQNIPAIQDQPAGRKPAEQQGADDDALQQRPQAGQTEAEPADPAGPPAAPNALPIPPIMHPPIQPPEENELHGPAEADADQSSGGPAEAGPPLRIRRCPVPAAVVADHQLEKKQAQLARETLEAREREDKELATAVAATKHGVEILDVVLAAAGAADAAPAPEAPEEAEVSAPEEPAPEEAAGSEAAAEATASATAASSDNLLQ